MATSGQLINYTNLVGGMSGLSYDTGLQENPGSNGKIFICSLPFQYCYLSTNSKPLIGDEPKCEIYVNDCTWTSQARTGYYSWREINHLTIGQSKESVHQTNKSGETWEYDVGCGLVMWRVKRLQGTSSRTHYRFAAGGLGNLSNGESYYNTWWKGQPICGYVGSQVHYLNDTWTVPSFNDIFLSTTAFARLDKGTQILASHANYCYPFIPCDPRG